MCGVSEVERGMWVQSVLRFGGGALEVWGVRGIWGLEVFWKYEGAEVKGLHEV